MSKNKFLDLMIYIEDQKWFFDKYGHIRNEKGQCPICAIVDVLSNGEIVTQITAFWTWITYTDQVMSVDEIRDMEEIISAADSSFHSFHSQLKKALHVQE